MNRRGFLKGMLGIAAAFPIVKANPSILIPRKRDIIVHTQFTDSWSEPWQDVLAIWNANYTYGYDACNDLTWLRVDVPMGDTTWHDVAMATGSKSEEFMKANAEHVFRRHVRSLRA